MFNEVLIYLKTHLPKFIFLRLRKFYYYWLNKLHPHLSEIEFRNLLTERLGVTKGSVVFVHSSVDKMFLNFPFYNLLPLLKELVGPDGTLLFPCYHFRNKAVEYIRNHNVVFDIQRSVTVNGLLPEMARMDEGAYRSLHPTNSVVAIGKYAEELTRYHQDTIYPFGEKSPFYGIIKYNGIIIGLGVGVDRLSFSHVVEDVLKDKFPIKTRDDTIYECKVIDNERNVKIVKTLVGAPQIEQRNVPKFIKKYISPEICKIIKYKGISFFKADAKQLYNEMLKLALKGETIYSC